MPRQKKITYAVISPKNDAAKIKMDYHGDTWIFRGEVDRLKYSGIGPWLVLMSRDGKKCIHVKKENDLSFNVRIL